MSLGDGILKRGDTKDLFEYFMASKGTLRIGPYLDTLNWDCVLGLGGHRMENRAAKFTCDLNKNKLTLELFENLSFTASLYDDKTKRLIEI